MYVHAKLQSSNKHSSALALHVVQYDILSNERRRSYNTDIDTVTLMMVKLGIFRLLFKAV